MCSAYLVNQAEIKLSFKIKKHMKAMARNSYKMKPLHLLNMQ